MSGLDNVHDTISTMTAYGHGVRMPEGMSEESAVGVYENYDLQHRYNTGLPITRHRQDVSQSVAHGCECKLSVCVCVQCP